MFIRIMTTKFIDVVVDKESVLLLHYNYGKFDSLFLIGDFINTTDVHLEDYQKCFIVRIQE